MVLILSIVYSIAEVRKSEAYVGLSRLKEYMNKEDRFDSLIVYHAERFGRDPRQVKRQLRAESNFDSTAVSTMGAAGLAQFVETTWGEWGTSNFNDASNPDFAIEAHCKYMNWLEKRLGNLKLALAAYNFGIGNVERKRPWPRETREYVKKCLAYEDEIIAA